MSPGLHGGGRSVGVHAAGRLLPEALLGAAGLHPSIGGAREASEGRRRMKLVIPALVEQHVSCFCLKHEGRSPLLVENHLFCPVSVSLFRSHSGIRHAVTDFCHKYMNISVHKAFPNVTSLG